MPMSSMISLLRQTSVRPIFGRTSNDKKNMKNMELIYCRLRVECINRSKCCVSHSFRIWNDRCAMRTTFSFCLSQTAKSEWLTSVLYSSQIAYHHIIGFNQVREEENVAAEFGEMGYWDSLTQTVQSLFAKQFCADLEWQRCSLDAFVSSSRTCPWDRANECKFNVTQSNTSPTTI